MYKFISMNAERKSEISEEELFDDDKDEHFVPEDDWDEYDEPEEREYCD